MLRYRSASTNGPAVLAAPSTETDVAPELKRRAKILPPWKVLLWNDDHNDMLYVVRCLVKSVPGLSASQAVAIMFEAHQTGKALVTVCPLELAELYRDRLSGYGLTATIEPA